MAKKKRKFEIAERESAEVNPFMARQGDYAMDVLVTSPGELGSGSRYGTAQVLRNHDSTAVDRWAKQGHIDPDQADAIKRYQRLHRLVFGSPKRVTMKWDDTPGGEDAEDCAGRRLDAKDALLEIDNKAFANLPPHFSDVWQNVVIHDSPLGEAGKYLIGFRSKGADAVARHIVQTVAWRISSLRVRFG